MTQPLFIDYSKVVFLKSSPNLNLAPNDTGIEVAFVGRSNAGKSSAINAIVNQHKLARTSKTPGRTQLINFFSIDEDRRIVDLPGYGYAKVPEKIHRQIEDILNTYLGQRQCLRGLILLMDIRHALTNNDYALLNIAREYELPVHILLTKSDKLKRGASNNILLDARKQLTDYKLVTVQTFSAHKLTGIEDARHKLTEWFTPKAL